MSDQHPGSESVKVFRVNTFKKAFKKLPSDHVGPVEDAIDDIVDSPEIGEQKKGDLSHLRVHKFRVKRTDYLLGYHWNGESLALYLLQLGSHENFYDEAKVKRKSHLGVILE